MSRLLKLVLRTRPKVYAAVWNQSSNIEYAQSGVVPGFKQLRHFTQRSFAVTAADTGVHLPSEIQGERLQQNDADTQRKILVNRLLYRSKQRGFLEMDLLVGLWAQRHVPQAAETMLADFEAVLDHENPDLYKWLTGQEVAPADMQQNQAFKALHASVGAQLRETVQDSARTRPGKEWVRGWDDWKRGNQPDSTQVDAQTAT